MAIVQVAYRKLIKRVVLRGEIIIIKDVYIKVIKKVKAKIKKVKKALK